MFKKGGKKPIAHLVKGSRYWMVFSKNPDWLLIFDAGQELTDAVQAFLKYAKKKIGDIPDGPKKRWKMGSSSKTHQV